MAQTDASIDEGSGWAKIVGAGGFIVLAVLAITAPYNPLLYSPQATMGFVLAFIVVSIVVTYVFIYRAYPATAVGEIVSVDDIDLAEEQEGKADEEVF